MYSEKYLEETQQIFIPTSVAKLRMSIWSKCYGLGTMERKGCGSPNGGWRRSKVLAQVSLFPDKFVPERFPCKLLGCIPYDRSL